MKVTTIIGAGLAGCEAAYQLAKRGHAVVLKDMKPTKRTPAQSSDAFAELVCSNSFRSTNPQNAVGLLKEEMRRLDSLVMRAASTAQVPAGDALAVDRARFAHEVRSTLDALPSLRIEVEEVSALPAGPDPVIVATGPLTSDALAADIQRATGAERLYFYDALAPIVDADTIDRKIVFPASRYDKGSPDYWNCPLTRDEYERFVDALLAGEQVPTHAFEEPRYFAGCLPIEVMAARGRDTLRFGPMKPVGLSDPRTGRWPYAAVQLRQEDVHAQSFNLVGFQTKLKYGEQKRIFAMIPGLEAAEFLRLGAMHRNTYLDSPRVLDAQMRLRDRPWIRFAGQITGVEGYIESAAHGLMVALDLHHELSSRLDADSPVSGTSTASVPYHAPPPETALGGLWAHVTGANHAPGQSHEPQNVNWSMVPPLDDPAAGDLGRRPQKGRRKADRKSARVTRARAALAEWAQSHRVPLSPPPVAPSDDSSGTGSESTTELVSTSVPATWES